MEDEVVVTEIRVGGIYEDCAYHPVVCTYASVGEDELRGISLIDGSGPRGCSLRHCGPELLTLDQAVWIKGHLEEYVQSRSQGGGLPAGVEGAAESFGL